MPPTPPKIKPASPVVAAPVIATDSSVQNTLANEPQQQTAQQIQAPQQTTTFTLDMVTIPKGSFTMGCKDGRDKDCYPDESPAHSVQVSAFQLGKTEVTQGQWQAVMGNNPSEFKNCGDNCPVENVSWEDIQIFIKKLNAQTGKTYRLPSEAEWEYACRAGQDSSHCGGNDVNAVALYGDNSGSKTHAVGGKQANAWGLHDMSGNVWEWVQDSSHSDYNNAPSNGSAWLGTESVGRVQRGGSWFDNSRFTRAAIRYGSTNRNSWVGFRLARTLP